MQRERAANRGRTATQNARALGGAARGVHASRRVQSHENAASLRCVNCLREMSGQKRLILRVNVCAAVDVAGPTAWRGVDGLAVLARTLARSWHGQKGRQRQHSALPGCWWSGGLGHEELRDLSVRNCGRPWAAGGWAGTDGPSTVSERAVGGPRDRDAAVLCPEGWDRPRTTSPRGVSPRDRDETVECGFGP